MNQAAEVLDQLSPSDGQIIRTLIDAERRLPGIAVEALWAAVTSPTSYSKQLRELGEGYSTTRRAGHAALRAVRSGIFIRLPDDMLTQPTQELLSSSQGFGRLYRAHQRAPWDPDLAAQVRSAQLGVFVASRTNLSGPTYHGL